MCVGVGTEGWGDKLSGGWAGSLLFARHLAPSRCSGNVCRTHKRKMEGDQCALSRKCMEDRLCSETPRTATTLPLRVPWGPSPLRHDLEGIRQVALHILHLERVSIADLVVRASIVGIFHHDDIAAWAPKLDGVAFTCQLPAHQPKWEPSPAQACGERGGRVSCSGHREGSEDPAEAPLPAWLYLGHMLYEPQFIHL